MRWGAVLVFCAMAAVPAYSAGDPCISPCGNILCWNMLGPFRHSFRQPPVGIETLRRDYMTDGAVGELDFVFEPGAVIRPDFRYDAASDGLYSPDPFDRNPLASEGTATVFAFTGSPDFFIDLDDAVFGGAPNYVMAYAQCYVTADRERELYCEVSSDDAVQVYCNEREVWMHDVARPTNDATPPFVPCEPQDTLLGPVVLKPCANRVLVKIWDWSGFWNFSFRFVDRDGEPVSEGLSISLTPPDGCPRAPLRATRTVETSEVVFAGEPRKVWRDDGERCDVRLDLSDIRGECERCTIPASITIGETVPDGWIPSEPSHGGAVDGHTITWVLTGEAIAPGALTYQVTTGGAHRHGRFRGTVADTGAACGFGVRGDGTVYFVRAPFERDDARTVTLVSTDFAGVSDFDCPAGWSCDGGMPWGDPFPREAGHEDRLRLMGGVSGVASALWNEPVDLRRYSFTAEFDVYLASPAGDTAAEGLAFIALDAETYELPAVGGGGAGLGYENLPRSFAVEIDLRQSDHREPSGYNNGLRPYAHVAALKDGWVTPHVQTHLDRDPTLRPRSFAGNPGRGWPGFLDLSGAGAIPVNVVVDYNNGTISVAVEAPETQTAGGAEPAFPLTTVIDTVVTLPLFGESDFLRADDGLQCEGGGAVHPLRQVYLGFAAATGSAGAIVEIDNLAIELYENPEPHVRFMRGEVNGDGTVDIGDAIFILTYLFAAGTAPSCLDAADTNDDGTIDLADGIAYLGHLFAQAGPLPDPFESCGTDPTVDQLDCVAFPLCP